MEDMAGGEDDGTIALDIELPVPNKHASLLFLMMCLVEVMLTSHQWPNLCAQLIGRPPRER